MKYFDFGSPSGQGKIEFSDQLKRRATSGKKVIWIDNVSTNTGTRIGVVDIENNDPDESKWREISTEVDQVTGRHAVYFKFIGDDDEKTICDFKSFKFKKG